MKETLLINGYCIKLRFKQHSVQLVCNYQLMAAVDASFTNIEWLCKEALNLHQIYFKSPLDMPLHSFIMEVLGHVYAYKILLRLRRIADWKVFRKLSLNACIIDCGDKSHDRNRWFWNLTGWIKPLLM